MLISFEIFSPGLNVTNNLASLLFFFGACKTGIDWAKHTFPEVSDMTITSQSLNLPIFFKSSAKVWVKEVIKITNDKVKKLSDVNKSELALLSILAIITIALGFYPNLILDTVDISVNNLIYNYENEIAQKISNLEWIILIHFTQKFFYL